MKRPVTKTLILLSLLGTLWLSGCGGNDAAVENYKSNINQFFENVTYFDSAMNGINPDSEEAVQELLAILDSMEVSFAEMAKLPVPSAFIGVEELADEASTYMTEAVSLYHQVLESEYFNQGIADAAKENYDRANLRIQYIISILHGDIPEEIIVMEGEEETAAEKDAK